MIVKNEEQMLAQCLRSVEAADEIIVVDTGSIDKTREIAARLADKVLDFEWCDDFALARNIAREACTGDWILSIDADEVLEDGGIEKIKNFLSIYEGDAVKVRMQASNQKFYGVRLFRNKAEVFWQGKIHEAINIVTDEKIQVGITFGSSPAHAFDPNRNLRILETEVINSPKNTRALYYLGREYGYRQQYNKAIEILTLYLNLGSWLPEKADAFFILALCYWYTERGENARENCLSALSINANFKAAVLLMGHMSFEKNKIQWDRMAETATNEDTLFARDNFLII